MAYKDHYAASEAQRSHCLAISFLQHVSTARFNSMSQQQWNRYVGSPLTTHMSMKKAVLAKWTLRRRRALSAVYGME